MPRENMQEWPQEAIKPRRAFLKKALRKIAEKWFLVSRSLKISLFVTSHLLSRTQEQEASKSQEKLAVLLIPEYALQSLKRLCLCFTEAWQNI